MTLTKAELADILVEKVSNISKNDAKEIVELGEIDPEDVITPGAFVDVIVHGEGDWTWGWQ